METQQIILLTIAFIWFLSGILVFIGFLKACKFKWSMFWDGRCGYGAFFLVLGLSIIIPPMVGFLNWMSKEENSKLDST